MGGEERSATPDFNAIVRGDRAALAAALGLLESGVTLTQTACKLLAQLPPPAASRRAIGITGPPGVGKSTLIGALIPRWRNADKTVAVLAVDPSSPISGGALLGDRLRMTRAVGDDEEVFIRSLAGRGEVGGLAAAVFPMSRLLLAVFDVVLVETIGVGQTEADITQLADVTALVLQPDSGDAIQFLKAGLLELPQLVVINKADGQRQQRAKQLVDELGAQPGFKAPVLEVSSRDELNIDLLAEALDNAQTSEAQHLARRRQAATWAMKRLRLEFGRHGIDALGGQEALRQRWLAGDRSPFDLLQSLREELLARWRGARRGSA